MLHLQLCFLSASCHFEANAEASFCLWTFLHSRAFTAPGTSWAHRCYLPGPEALWFVTLVSSLQSVLRVPSGLPHQCAIWVVGGKQPGHTAWFGLSAIFIFRVSWVFFPVGIPPFLRVFEHAGSLGSLHVAWWKWLLGFTLTWTMIHQS